MKLKKRFYYLKMRNYLYIFFACLALAACSSGRYTVGGSYHGAVQCVPFARKETGIALRGNAAQWWRASRGHYQHSFKPISGSVIVFKATRKMPYGHVAVVKDIVSSRRILVDHANWLPGRVEYRVPIEDVSSARNWSVVRVWWEPSDNFGIRSYPIYGFIVPK